jgi:hypothetical protein
LCAWVLGSHLRLPLPAESPEMFRHHPTWNVPFKTLQLITPGLTTLSISEHTYFLISFLLSGFTFIASKCYSLSSPREFMFPSSIHLPTTSVNSHWGKDLIFKRNVYFRLTVNYTWHISEVLPNLPLRLIGCVLSISTHLSMSFLLSSL